jgi:hypothetical protein
MNQLVQQKMYRPTFEAGFKLALAVGRDSDSGLGCYYYIIIHVHVIKLFTLKVIILKRSGSSMSILSVFCDPTIQIIQVIFWFVESLSESPYV